MRICVSSGDSDGALGNPEFCFTCKNACNATQITWSLKVFTDAFAMFVFLGIHLMIAPAIIKEVIQPFHQRKGHVRTIN